MSEQPLQDHGPEPFVIDIERATLSNENFRTALWTGEHMQMTVMSVPVGGEVGLEMHDDRDQFLRVEAGVARVQMGPAEDELPFDRRVEDDWVILVPAGSWHNVTNVGEEPLKLYSLYGPPEHAKSTVHRTKAESDADEHDD